VAAFLAVSTSMCRDQGVESLSCVLRVTVPLMPATLVNFFANGSMPLDNGGAIPLDISDSPA
jgi:hypothetical protein